MILCTISQFSCVLSHLGSSLIVDYQITSDEFEFIQLVHNYENPHSEEDLVQIIDQYERLYPHINTPRLVALNLLTYHYTIAPLSFDPTVLASYQAKAAEQAQQRIVVKSTPDNIKNPLNAIGNNREIIPDPMLQVASGFFVNSESANNK